MSLALLFNQPRGVAHTLTLSDSLTIADTPITGSITAINLVQETTGHGTGASYTKAFTSSVTAGNLIVIVLTDAAGTSGTVLGISDTQGNSYTQTSLAYASGIGQTAIWCAVAKASGSNSVTVTSNASSPNLFVYLNEFISATGWPSSPVDTATVATGTGLTASSGNITTGANGELIFGYFPNGIQTPESGFTLLTDANAIEYQVQATAGTVAATGTQFVSGAWQALVVAFKPTTTIALVQGKANYESGSGSLTVSYPSSVTTGNLLVVAASDKSSASATLGVSDSLGNTYTQVVTGSDATNTTATSIWWAIAKSSGSNTVTITSTGTYIFGYVHEFSSVTGWNTSPFDVSAFATGTSTTPSSGSVTTTVAGELVFGYVPNGCTPGIGFTQAAGEYNAIEYLTQSNVGSVAANGTTANAFPWGAAVATFKPFTGGTSTSGPFIRSITIDHTQVPLDQSNFPVLVRITDSTLKSVGYGGHVQSSSGYDITVTSDSGGLTLLAWEVEQYDPTTGTLVLWVNVPTVSSTVDTVVYLRYGDSSITTDQSNSTGTWESSFFGVWHLTNSSNLGKDSTSNANNGVNNGATLSTDNSVGAACASFVAANTQYISVPDATSLNPPSVITLSGWINPQNQSVLWNNPFGKLPVGASPGGYGFWFYSSSTQVQADINEASAYAQQILSVGSWSHIAMTFDGSYIRLFINGVLNQTESHSSSITPVTNPFVMGANTDHSLCYDGLLAEIQGSSVSRSSEYIATAYANQKPSSTFLMLGTEQTASTTQNYTKTLSESFTIAEVFYRQLNRSYSESFTIQSVLGKIPSRAITDAISVVDALQRQPQKAATETFSITEQIGRAPQRIFTESIGLTEQIGRKAIRLFTETFSITDLMTRGTSYVLTEALGLTEQIARATSRLLTESFSITERITRTVTRLFTESFGLVDQIARSVARSLALTDAVNLAEQLSRGTVRLFAESFTVTDALSRSISRVLQLVDVVTLAEQFGRSVGRVLSLSDSIVLTEQISRAINRAFTEALNVTDSVARTATRLFTETLAITERFSKTANRTVAETFTIAEQIGRVIGRSFTETFTLSDVLFTGAQRIFTQLLADSLTLSESLGRSIQRQITDALILGDQIFRTGQKVTTDGLTVTDYPVTRSGQKVVADAVTVVDQSIVRLLQRSINDAFAIAEQITRSTQKKIADAFTLSDIISISRAKILALIDSFSISDSIGKKADLLFLEAIALADILGTLGADVLTLTDVFVLSESIVKQVQRGLGDTFSIGDTLGYLRGRAIAFIDGFNLTESIQKRTSKLLADPVLLVERMGRAVGRAFVEAFTLGESFLARELTVLLLSDEIILGDSLFRVAEKLFIELLTLDERVTRSITHSFFDQLSIGDVLQFLVLGPVLLVYQLRQYFAELWRRYFTAEVVLRSFAAEDIQTLTGATEIVQRSYAAGNFLRNWSATDFMIYADPKDAESTEDFEVDWSAVIGDDTITASDWEGLGAMTVVEKTYTATTATVRLSGGVVGQRYTIKNVITLSSGQVKVQSLQLPII